MSEQEHREGSEELHGHCHCGCEEEHLGRHHHGEHCCEDSHEYHHRHDGHCGCEDDDDDDCCGHEHHHREEHHHQPVIHSAGVVRKVYRMTGLDCANCAAKMERQINELPEVEEATLTFATEQLRVWAKDPDALLPQMQAICSKIEPEAKLEPMSRKKVASSEEEEENALPKIIAGAVLFVAGKLLEIFLAPALGLPISPIALAVYIIGYLLLGFDVLKTAVINLTHGQVFDENFLMSIATLGAFGIGEYPEAVGVMLFYQIGEYFEDSWCSLTAAQFPSPPRKRRQAIWSRSVPETGSLWTALWWRARARSTPPPSPESLSLLLSVPETVSSPAVSIPPAF